MTTQPVLEVRGLSIAFKQYGRGVRQTLLPVISDLSVTVNPGEMVAVVGSSGSGKSLLAHGILGILPYNAVLEGDIRYWGSPLDQKAKEALRGGEIVLVPQSVAYLDPLMQVGPQLRKGRKDATFKQKSLAVLERYGMGEEAERLYPFELSGGMARRVLISTAVMETPRLVIADEPTPGLHITAAKRVLSHFREIADGGAGVLLITHDLELALEVADRVAVFYAGTTVEEASVTDFGLEETLRHPYTKALWRAMPQHGFQCIGGAQPFAGSLPQGCAFAPRCQLATDACTTGDIPYRPLRGGYVRCILGAAQMGEEGDT